MLPQNEFSFVSIPSDENYLRKAESFLQKANTLGREIPTDEVKEMVADIVNVLEQHHVTYNQSHRILDLARDLIGLKIAQIRL